MKIKYLLMSTCIIGKKGEIFEFDSDTQQIYRDPRRRISILAIDNFDKYFKMLSDEKVFTVGATKFIINSDGLLFVNGRQIGKEWASLAAKASSKIMTEGVLINFVKVFGCTMSIEKYTEILDYAITVRDASSKKESSPID